MIAYQDRRWPVPPPFRRNVVRARKAAGLSQQALADHMGVGLQTVQKIEQGRHTVPLGLAVRLAAALDTTVAALLGET